MNLFNLFKIAYLALMRNKTRALLTMLGIVIGIASVIAMVSLGQSSTQSINDQMSSMGANMITVQRVRNFGSGANLGGANVQTLTEADVAAIKQRATSVLYVSPLVSSNGQLIYGNNNYPSGVQGGNVDYFSIRKLDLARGSIFTNADVRSFAKVCVVGQTIVDNLFTNGEDPIGKTIRFNSILFRIIGVLEAKGQNAMGQDQDDIVIAPYTTIQKRVLGVTYLSMIYASALDENSIDAASAEITEIIRKEHRLQPGEPDDFQVRVQQQMIDMVNSTTQFLTILLAIIASISLLVGGIGIMNIMYVTVTERTKEIGLRMAIGAQTRDIMLQFLTESSILSLIGGVLGILLGLIISFLISYFLNWPFVVSMLAIIGSFAACVLTGVFFGWYPAKKAASLDPIVALRYE
jgi:putative ABC transport system permease protein